MTYGPTLTGFNRKRAEDIKRELEESIQSDEGFGANTPVKDTPLEQLIGVFAAELGTSWEALEQTYNAFDPDAAEGKGLKNVMAMTGLNVNGETYSTGVLEITGDANTFIETGFEVRRSDTDARFETIEDATIPDTGEPAGTETVDVAIRAVDPGPIPAPTGTIDEAVSLVVGVESVTNPVDLTEGQHAETDPEARIRREQSLQVLGKGTVNGIRADLLELDYVEAAVVLENDTGSVDANGLREWSLRPVLFPEQVDPDRRDEIVKLLWEHKGGIYYDASDVVADVTDLETGLVRTVRWDWADEVNIYVDVTVTTNNSYPPDGDTQVTMAIEGVLEELQVGDNVRTLPIYAAIDEIEGVESVTLKIDTVDPPGGSTDIAIAATEVANSDGITVTS